MRHDPEPTDEAGAPDADEDARDAVVVPITDAIDLHTFRPSDIGGVVREYLDQVCERGLSRVRIIHGRGAGVQRRRIRSLLEKDPRVRRFRDAPPEDGGVGATLVELDPPK